MSTEPAIEFDAVTKKFANSGPAAVRDLSLRIDTGELVTFVGPSGCGKTTTLRLINRLIEVSSGTIRVAGRDIRQVPVTQLRRDIGYVIQNVGLFPHWTVAQNIAAVPSLLGWPRQEIADRVDELLDLVGLDGSHLSRYPSALSGGQQQRVGVARALAARPSVLLMDEPYSAVDPIVRLRLQDELLELHHRLGTTIVVVTHDIDEALRLGTRVAVFGDGGRLAQVGTPDEVMAHPADEFVQQFIGADRQLRRLALRQLSSLPLDPADPDLIRSLRAGNAIELDAALTGRNAVDAMLAAGVTRLAVRGTDGVLGSITLTQLSACLK